MLSADSAMEKERVRNHIFIMGQPISGSLAREAAGNFAIYGEFEEISPFGRGHINDTFLSRWNQAGTFEAGESEKAIAHWKESIRRAENPWAYRNLAQASIRRREYYPWIEKFMTCTSIYGPAITIRMI